MFLMTLIALFPNNLNNDYTSHDLRNLHTLNKPTFVNLNKTETSLIILTSLVVLIILIR